MSLRVIATDSDLAEGAAHLASVCPVWAQVLPQLGPLPLRRRADGFGALMSAIVSQQISTAAAASISARLAAAGLDRLEAIMAGDDAALRACGLSGQKVRYLRALAGAGIDFDALRGMADEEVSARCVFEAATAALCDGGAEGGGDDDVVGVLLDHTWATGAGHMVGDLLEAAGSVLVLAGCL